MGDLPQYVIAKVSGPAWEPLRGQFLEIGRLLMDACLPTLIASGSGAIPGSRRALCRKAGLMLPSG